MRFVHFGLRAVGWILMIIGVANVIPWSINRLFPDQPTLASISPNGSLKALLVVRAGGGGLSPYCNSSVYVVPTAEALPMPDDIVFRGDCVTLQEFKKQVTWLSDGILQITVPVLLSDMYFRSVDKSRRVRVLFAVTK